MPNRRAFSGRLNKAQSKILEAPIQGFVKSLSDDRLAALLVIDVHRKPRRRPEAVTCFGEAKVAELERLPDAELWQIVGALPPALLKGGKP